MAEEKLLRRKCDYCDETQEFSDEQLTPGDAARVAGWIVLVRVFLVKNQTYPVQKHACKDSCASNIISLGMLDLPKEIKDMLAEEKQRASAGPAFSGHHSGHGPRAVPAVGEA
jgi:hypothetical protein